MSLRCIAMLIFMMISSLNGFITLRFIDYITKASSEVYDGENIRSDTIVLYTTFFLLGLLLTNIITQYSTTFKIKLDTQVDEYVNAKFKKKLSLIHFEYFESTNIYEKITRVNDKFLAGYNAAIESIVKILEIFFFMTVYIIYLSKINIIFALLVVISIVFSGIMATKMSKTKQKMFIDITKLNQKRDYLNQIPRDKIMHQEYQSGRLFNVLFQKYKEAYLDSQSGYLKIHKYTIFAESKALLLFIVTIIIAYLYISFQIKNNIVAVGSIISLMIIFDNLYAKSEALSYFVSNRVEDMLIINEYYEIMEYLESNSDFENYSSNNSINFKNVSYTYPQSNHKALDGLSIHIKSGEKIAIVGENGSGKTTFANVLLGLLIQFEGEVQIGDKTYTKDNPPPLRRIQSLNQDFTMYQMKIRDNILLGNNEDISNDKLMSILDMVGIGQFIRSLPDQVETHLGQLMDQGIEISKGQEQKIAAARIIVNSDTPIWIFDEPTAYLDPLAEIDMYYFLHQLTNSKTMLFISHRLGFAPMADRIIVFNHGKIAEMGTHEELIKKQGIYTQMYEAQKSWYEN
jgi:ABC-type bacteriocin/lantibiotic exporters, contain an N-terminal double-glycine peptidase domain